MSLAAKLLSASGGGVDKLYSDDVFSAFTYTGNGATQTITNGIDLAGKGGLTWIKRRNGADSHRLFDTTRGPNKMLMSDLTNSQISTTDAFNSFNSEGFSLGADAGNWTNFSGSPYISWTFRKSPKFFDIVTYTGNGVAGRQIPHALGIAQGMTIVKATSTTGDWITYHTFASGDLFLNTTAAQSGSGNALINGRNATHFIVSGVANTNAVTYVAYLFAHDPSADGIIQCGSFTTDGSGKVPVVTLGWEPQYLLLKAASTTGDWDILDTSRVLTVSRGETLRAQSSAAETNLYIGDYLPITATGFGGATAGLYGASTTVIYLAIRRPNKPPTLGTQVYNAIARTGTGGSATVTGVGFAPDLVINKRNDLTEAGESEFHDRLRGRDAILKSGLTDAEINYASSTQDLVSFDMDGISVGTGAFSQINYTSRKNINHFFKRAPGVFDVVCWTGDGAFNPQAHGLQAIPELVIQKARITETDGWRVWRPGNPVGTLALNTTAAITGSFDISATSATFKKYWDTSGITYVAYLFATKAGISRVGNYTGNGTSQTIDCGFTTGARFVMIKATSTTGDWNVFDTTRGIVAGFDPYLALNTTTAEVANKDALDPASSGFIVNGGTAAFVNESGVSYIYLAFA